MKLLSVILVDDHQLFREGLKLILQNLPYINEIREASNGKEYLELLNSSTPDIVFIDIEMPVLNGIDATHQSLIKYPNLNIIGLSMYGDEEYYSKMIEAGAKGFILKNSNIHDLESAIQNVTEGNNYFSQEVLSRMLKNLSKKTLLQKNSDLSEREEEVLYHICKGLSNQEISDILHISKRTVDKHRENLLSKTGVKNTAGLVMYAIKNKIVEV